MWEESEVVPINLRLKSMGSWITDPFVKHGSRMFDGYCREVFGEDSSFSFNGLKVGQSVVPIGRDGATGSNDYRHNSDVWCKATSVEPVFTHETS